MKIIKKITVRNVSGSSKKWPNPTCPCDTWIEHWELNSEYTKPYACPACNSVPDDKNIWVGGHVQKVARNSSDEFILAEDEDIYIVPICMSCNNVDKKVFSVDEKYLVKMAASECKLQTIMEDL